jgi:mediator of RNA polymerase II transcription subunit 12
LIHPDSDVLAPLTDRLRVLLKKLMTAHPEGFISSKPWITYRGAITSSLAVDDPRFASIISSIDRRNSRFAVPGAEKAQTPRMRLIQLLDTTFSKPFTSDLLEKCWRVDDDKEMILRTVLEWATSLYRPGTAKIYVAVRLFRHWTASGADVTQAILNFIDSEVCEIGRSKTALYHLVCELARSEHFSIPMYLQWLIARGGLYDAADVSPNGPSATRLLVELPAYSLTESMDALRRTLLGRADYSIEDEEQQVTAYMAYLNKRLPGMQASVDPENDANMDIGDETHELAPALSRGNQSEIGLWLRQKVGLQMLQPTIPPLDNWDHSPMKGGTSAITLSDFIVVRQTLEEIEDFSILADVLKIVSSSNDAEVLASCTDTINLHLDSFAAIGAAKGLFDTLTSRLHSLADEDSFPRVLLASLCQLATRIPGQDIISRKLIQDLSRSDRKTAADACSPVSDHMVGVTQTPEADFNDEIEKILASGTSMDQATLGRLFQRITNRLEETWEKAPDQYRSCGLLLTRLRAFDAQPFDTLMAGWVSGFFQMETRPSIIYVFGPLISFGCLSLRDVVTNSTAVIEKGASQDSPIYSRISEEVLALLVERSDSLKMMTSEEVYRLRIHQTNVQRDYPSDILPVIRRFLALDSSKSSDEPGTLPSRILPGMHDFLQRQALLDTDSLIRMLVLPLLASSNTRASSTISAIVDKLLMEGGHHSAASMSIDVVLNLADDFTLPFCQIKLASIFSPSQSSSESTEGVDGNESALLEAFDTAIDSAIAGKNTAWTCIIPLLDISISRHLRHRAESQFIAIFPSGKTASTNDIATLQNGLDQATNLLYIINTTAFSIPNPPTTSLAPEIVAMLNTLWSLLGSSSGPTPDTKGVVVAKWLPLLLSFTTIHFSAFGNAKFAHEYRSKALIALAAILLELQALDDTVEGINAAREGTFDVALHLVDALPDASRQQCISSMREVHNRRISYLFSITTDPSDWLVLSQKERIHVSGVPERRATGMEKEKLVPYPLRRWEMLGEPTPNIGENDTSLSLTLFGARKG